MKVFRTFSKQQTNQDPWSRDLFNLVSKKGTQRRFYSVCFDYLSMNTVARILSHKFLQCLFLDEATKTVKQCFADKSNANTVRSTCSKCKCKCEIKNYMIFFSFQVAFCICIFICLCESALTTLLCTPYCMISAFSKKNIINK